MSDSWWRWCRRFARDLDNLDNLNLFSDPLTETLSQAISAASGSEEQDEEARVLFGHLRGTVVGLRYYTGVVSTSHSLLWTSSPQLTGICRT